MTTTTTKAMESVVNANQLLSSTRTIAADTTAIAAAISFEANFMPIPGVSRPAGRAAAREDQVGERVERGQQRRRERDRAPEGAPDVRGVGGRCVGGHEDQRVHASML